LPIITAISYAPQVECGMQTIGRSNSSTHFLVRRTKFVNTAILNVI